MSRTHDIIIVGAGIIGAACAEQCAQAGLKTLVLERGAIAGGTTSAGMGHLVVMDDSEPQLSLTEYGRRLWLELRSRLPSDMAYEVCGTIWIAADEDEMAVARRKYAAYAARGLRVEMLDSDSLHGLEPNLRLGLAGGLRVLDDGVLHPPPAAHWLLEKAREHGAECRCGVAVKSLTTTGGVTLADGSILSAGRVVNAAGPWSPELMPGLPVRKRKGHLIITDRHPHLVRHQIVELGYFKSAHSLSEDSVAFNIQPRRDGQMLIGSSRQFNADTTEVEPEILARMLARAAEFIPGLAQLFPSRVWAGHRAATPDKLPLIGPSAESDRLWLATGHEGLGITTSLATGRLLADLLMARPTAIPSAPYAPARFHSGAAPLHSQ